jgi:hypothetical protein
VSVNFYRSWRGLWLSCVCRLASFSRTACPQPAFFRITHKPFFDPSDGSFLLICSTRLLGLVVYHLYHPFVFLFLFFDFCCPCAAQFLANSRRCRQARQDRGAWVYLVYVFFFFSLPSTRKCARYICGRFVVFLVFAIFFFLCKQPILPLLAFAHGQQALAHHKNRFGTRLVCTNWIPNFPFCAFLHGSQGRHPLPLGVWGIGKATSTTFPHRLPLLPCYAASTSSIPGACYSSNAASVSQLFRFPPQHKPDFGWASIVLFFLCILLFVTHW